MKADRIVIVKSARTLTLPNHGRVVKIYQIARVGSLHREMDWTAGCIAVTNPAIEEIDRPVPVGTPVEIRADQKP